MTRRSINGAITVTLTVASFFLAQIANADIVEFSLQGAAGGGVTAANEPGNTGAGSGDLIAVSVYDTDTNELSLNVAWGSGNGFTDLTSNATLVNLHFVDSGVPPDVFNQSGDAFLTFNVVDQSPTSGGFNDVVVIDQAREADLLAGRVYLHLHTDNFGDGEARGYLIVVPDPHVLGDANDDGVFDNADIASFVFALTNAVAYEAMFPDVDPDVVLDMNGDGVFNNGDIAGFVAALTGGGTK